MTQADQRKPLRSFGLLVGAIFGVISIWPWVFHGEHIRIWAFVPAGILVAFALLFPTGLKPIFKLWMALGRGLGWFNTRVILALGFYGMFTPIGMVMGLLGKDPMTRKFDPNETTYRVRRPLRSKQTMRQQF